MKKKTWGWTAAAAALMLAVALAGCGALQPQRVEVVVVVATPATPAETMPADGTPTPETEATPAETMPADGTPTPETEATPAEIMPADGTPTATATALADPRPVHATRLESGETAIPPWGYGPWAPKEVRVPKVAPGGQVSVGMSQLVSDFDGTNWEAQGEWCFTLPATAKAVWAVTQGDAPLRVTITADRLCMETNSEVTGAAPRPLENHEALLRFWQEAQSGSSGVSLVVYTE